MIFDFLKCQRDIIPLYTEGKQDGFITQKNALCDKRMKMPEINSGMQPVYWAENYELSRICLDEHGYYISYDGEGFIPLTFACNVADEGNYRVKLTLYAEEDVCEGMIFQGRRCLSKVLWLKKDNTYNYSFITSVRPIIPRNYEKVENDSSIDITLIGRGLHLSAIEIEKVTVRTIYIAGDSTVTDQPADYPYYPELSYCGWGQMLPAYLGDQIAVSNHAHSGLTTESFRSEGHYQVILDRILKDDIFLIQFGHNDQKLDELKADEGYRANLNRYIDEIREKKAIPVIITPLARNSWKGNDGSYNDLLSEYARVCKEVGRDRNVPVIDLHEKSMNLIQGEGCVLAKRFFFPSDYTHSNDYGAFLFAGYVCEGLKAFGLNMECNGSELIPKSGRQITIPECLRDKTDIPRELLFAELERPDDILTRAEAFEMVIKTMKYFPTNVYNDMFTDVIGHETYAGSIECAYQNGLIPDTFAENGMIYPKNSVTGREFLKILEIGYKSRKNEDLDRDYFEKFGNDNPLTRRIAADICEKVDI